MKIKELRQLSEQELALKEQGAKKELFNLYFLKEVGQVEKPGQFRNLRRQVAKIKTVLKEREKDSNGKN